MGGIPTFYKELFLTYVLLFGRDARSPQIATSKVELHSDFVELLRVSYDKEPSILSLPTFVVYGTPLRTIQDTLEKWRPQSITQLAVRPYHERMSNYASPVLYNSSVIDYLNMRDEGGLVKRLVKVEIACFGQHRG